MVGRVAEQHNWYICWLYADTWLVNAVGDHSFVTLFVCDNYDTYETHIGHIDKGEEFEDIWDVRGRVAEQHNRYADIMYHIVGDRGFVAFLFDNYDMRLTLVTLTKGEEFEDMWAGERQSSIGAQ